MELSIEMAKQSHRINGLISEMVWRSAVYLKSISSSLATAKIISGLSYCTCYRPSKYAALCQFQIKLSGLLLFLDEIPM